MFSPLYINVSINATLFACLEIIYRFQNRKNINGFSNTFHNLINRLLTAITTNVLDLAKKPLTYWLVAEGLKSIHDQGAKTDNIVLGVDATTMLQLNLDAQQNNLTIVPLGREVNGIKLQTVVTPLGEVAVP